jgi:thymidylate kinase
MGPWGHVRTSVLKFCLRKKILPAGEDWFGALVQKIQSENSKHTILFILKKLISSQLKGWIYFAALYYEMWYRYLSEVRPALKKGITVLSDRYIYDARFIYKKRAISQFGWWRRFICFFYPKPRQIFYLFNTPQQIVQRKAQLKEDEIRLFQDFYRRVLVNKQVEELNTQKSPEELAKETVKTIINIYLSQNQP